VSKVCKTGAGAALLGDHDLAVALARAAREGSGLPVTAKLRSGRRPGGREGVLLARRLVDEAGVAGIGFHPRSAAVAHAGRPDYELAAELVRTLDAPVILSGGMRSAEAARSAQEQTGAAAVMLARGVLGNPWLFAAALGRRDGEPAPAEVLAELDWVMDRAVEHLGAERATRYLRKFYPWYLTRLDAPPAAADGLARCPSIGAARALLDELEAAPAAV
jgi:tRNA-dihydrouridine synthase